MVHTGGAGAIDHLAFRASGLGEYKRRVNARADIGQVRGPA